VSATANSDIWGAQRPLAIAWLATKTKERELQAARDAAEAKEFTKDAGAAAKRSAMYTLWISLATFLAVVVAVIPLFKR
jgi:hypothetical protein